MMYGTHLFVLSIVLKTAVAAAVVVAVAAPKFSQYKVLWGSFAQARVSEYQRFDSCWCFISAI
jgi:hypothetical protein